MRPLTVAVTGLSATDSPAPGVAVIRAIRDADPRTRIVGLAYETLDPGAYISGLADHVYLLPYPSLGADAMFERLLAAHRQTPFDVLIPTLDSEMPAMVRLGARLRDVGIRTFLPQHDSLELRAKDRFGELRETHAVSVPRGAAITDARDLSHLDLRYPLMVKGQFYEAYIAYGPADVHARFQQIAGKWGVPVVLQEFVAGEEYDVVALGDGDGLLVGSVAMRKMQLTDKGKAWGGVTVADPALESFVRDVIKKLRWRGPCELEIMREKETGLLFVIEINPRFPAWVYLTVGAGRNLPWAAVRLARGEVVESMDPAPPGVMFLRHCQEQICSMADFQSLATVGELHRIETTELHRIEKTELQKLPTQSSLTPALESAR